ncbi:MAG TPA: hypothetical protein VFL64_17450 [Rhizobacter sp.]|nr:hypothetical protein [Rhizobacter sp.]
MRLHTLSLAMASVGLMAACGGGGGDSAPAPAPSGPTQITLTGVVAKGAALAGAAVTAKCATGTGTATASGTGSYTITITSGALPCVLEAVGTGADAGLELHSVATGTGSTATANITPVTELLVAQLTGQNPSDFMDAASASTLSTTVTTTNMASAKTEVIATLSAAGLDTTALTSADMVSGTLQAGSGTGYDGVLDALGTALSTSNTTLATLTQVVATTAAATQAGNSAQPPAETGQPLPAGLMLLPKAANCDSLRSTNYRLIKIAKSVSTADGAPITTIENMAIDAAALTATFGPGDVMQMTANGTCRYTLPNSGEAMVAPSGVIVVRALVGADDDTVAVEHRNTYRMMIALPAQDIPLADLAATWNFIGMNAADTGPTYVPFDGTLALNATGGVSGMRCFDDPLGTADASCTAVADAPPALSVNSAGGFNLSSTDPADPWVDRLWAFKGGNGQMMLLTINTLGEFAIGTRQHAVPLPAANDATNSLTMIAGQTLQSTASGGQITSAAHTITSVDTATKTVVRNSSTDGAAAVQQTLVYDSARTGYMVRNASTGVRAFKGLPIQGLGLTAFYLPNTATAPANNSGFALSARYAVAP